MRDIPECLNRRYKALDELIKELGTYGASTLNPDSSSDDPEIKLMCEFWNILKEDPGINLKQAVQHRMGLNAIGSGLFGQNVDCYMAGCCKKDSTKKEETENKIKNLCCKGSTESSKTHPRAKISISSKPSSPKTPDPLPLNKVLCNLKEAASFEKKCQGKVNDLLENQKQLQGQIVILEQREKDGMQLLKKADCMWSCMEESYKRNIAESLERQQVLLKQLKEVEASNKKWRKNKKDLEFEMDNITKCHQEIVEQINHKNNDVKFIDLEITNFKNRIESDKKDNELALKSLTNKKQTSDGKIATMVTEIAKLENMLIDEQKYKVTKEQEGRKYVKEAREDLQKFCKILLQKKLENEDMAAEREALILEFEMLKQTCDQCREKCKNKQESVIDEIKTIEKEIAEFKVRCIRCHECTDTIDVRKFCTDCPRCVNEQECLYEEGYCNPDHAMDCVCMIIKQKFLDNVFDNMYTLLERQVKTGQGKAVAEAVMNCLKKSRNGKINDDTKKLLQDFILTTVKKNLKLTIIGGAVKTRCEDPCKRWGGSSECNCPKGPKACVCIGKGLLSSTEAQTCPPQVEDKEDAGEVIACPHRDSAPCGPDCAARSSVGSEVASWRPSPCQGPTCNFKNMRAAQCVLGPEVLSSVSGPGCISPQITMSPILGNQATCKCSGSPTISCTCHKDSKQLKARIAGVCDKNKCETLWKCFDTREKNRENKHITFQNLATKTKVLCDEIIKLADTTEVLKTSPDDLRQALNKNLLELMDKKKLKSCNLRTTLKDTNIKKEFDDHLLDQTVPQTPVTDTTPTILARKSGNNLLEIDKCLLNNKERSKINLNSDKTRKDNKKDIQRKISKEIFNIKVKGANCNEKEPLFALKSTHSGNFEIVLDKDYEKWYKQTIKEHKGEDNEEYLQLTKTESNNFVINLENNRENNLRNKSALMVKSDSGNIKVIMKEREPFKTDSKSIISIRTFNNLLNKLPNSSTQIHRENIKKSRLRMEKSSSDSYVYGTTKFNLQNEQNFPSELTPVLRKTSSGEYAVILNKDSKKSFINNLKSYLTTSSKGLVPIKRTDSGVIYVDLSNNEHSLSSYGSVKITPSGNIYISLNEQGLFPSTITHPLNTTKKNSLCKDTTARCKARNTNSSSECTCKNVCYKSKKWFLEQSKEGSSETHPCGKKTLNNKNEFKPSFDKGHEHKNSKSKCLHNLENLIVENKSPHIVIKPCGCRPMLEKTSTEDCYCFIQSICPYHIDRYEEVSNEILEITGLCSGSKSINEPNPVLVKNEKNLLNAGDKIKHTSLDWDSLEYLPPQLPVFLRDFNCV